MKTIKERQMLRQTLLALAAVGLGTCVILPNAAMAQSSTDRSPEFVGSAGVCGQFGQTDFGRASEAGKNAGSEVLVRKIMRRCFMEGVPVTSAEEVRIAPAIEMLTKAIGTTLGDPVGSKRVIDTFLDQVRPMLSQGFNGERMRRVEGHVAAYLSPASAPRTSDRSQMITDIQRQSGAEYYQPEFKRGPGCTVFGDTSVPQGAPRDAVMATHRAVMQSTFRRCLFENVALTQAEDAALFPALRRLAEGAGPKEYKALATQARRTLDPARAGQVQGNILEAQRGTGNMRFPRTR
jgi:hypothetical protein